MSIKVSLGTNNSDDRELTKDITWAAVGDPASTEIDCDVYNPVDRLNPIILLSKDKVDLTNINYMYIPEFGRYYFITNIIGASGNRAEVHGHVDVLMSFDAQIRESHVIAERSTSNYNFFLHDNLRLNNSYLINQYVNIGQDIGQPDMIYLITLGEGGRDPS